MAESSCVNWLLGRGLSIGCNLTWTVPAEWRSLRREMQIPRIEDAIRKAMGETTIDRGVIQDFLEMLESRTKAPWRHRFITTNWDYLLQEEVLQLGLEVQPDWLDNSHVFHLNGTAEILPDNSQRSAFVLEEDSAEQRISTTEANIVWNQILWDQTFVVVGMSFECEGDRFLLTSLGKVQDEMPIGESSWIVVNPDQDALVASSTRLRQKLPCASVIEVPKKLEEWLSDVPPELVRLGVLKGH